MYQHFIFHNLKHPAQRAVTLLEMSIVIVVIGLIVGGISVGVSLKENAKIQGVIADKEKVMDSLDLYMQKYKSMPGDHGTAESFFGAAATDNGNDNGYLDLPSTNKEVWLFWQHLSLAGLWNSKFTGINGSSATNTLYDAVINVNVPKSTYEGVGYSVHYVPAGSTSYGETPQRHFLVAGKDWCTDNTLTYCGWISPVSIKNIDIKLDDGYANSGSIRTYIATANLNTTGCTTGAAPNYVYNIASSTALCNMLFMFDPFE